MKELKNIQLHQLFNLLLLIYIAYTNNTLHIGFLYIFLLTLFSVALELLFKRELFIPFSATITALGVILMLGWTLWYIPFAVITLALLQKHYLKIDNKHIFNPSNFALIIAITLFYPKALPIVGALGNDSYILYLVLTIGVVILIRANRYLISISFLLSYILLNFVIFSKIDPYWNSEHFISSLYSISFIVYIFFMLTDPITTPSKKTHQIYFGLIVATTIVTLNYIFGYRLLHIFMALFITSIVFVPLYRKLEKLKFIILLLITTTVIYRLSLLKPLYFSM